MDQQNQNPLPPSSSQSPQKPASSKHYRSFWPIVLIAALSALVGGIIVWAAYNAGLDEELNSLLPGTDRRFVRQQKNIQLEPMTSNAEEAAAGNLTYRNEEYGFEISYPENLKLVASAPKSGGYQLILNEEGNNLFMMVIRINGPDIDQQNNSNVGKIYSLVSESKMIKVVNISDTGKTYSNPGGVIFKSGISNIVLSSNGDKYYFTSSQIYNPNSSVDLYIDILSTFKFTK